MYLVNLNNLKSAPIDTAAGGTYQLLTTAATVKFRVFRIFFTLASGTVKIKSGSTDLTGPMGLTSFSQDEFKIGDQTNPVFEAAAAGDDLILEFSAAAQCSGRFWYMDEAPGSGL